MKYTENYTVRWHDTDAGRILRPSSALACLQEVANRQCGTYGKDLDLMRDEDGTGFILTRLELHFLKPVRTKDQLQIDTWISDVRGISTCREFRMSRDGKPVVEGSSHWVLLDVKTQSILKVTEYPYEYPRDEAQPFTPPMRLRLPSDMEEIGTRRISYADIDYNMHMNNTKYPDMLMDFLPDDMALTHYPTRMVLIFQNGARNGETLSVFRSPVPDKENAFFFATKDSAGKACLSAEVELTPRDSF